MLSLNVSCQLMQAERVWCTGYSLPDTIHAEVDQRLNAFAPPFSAGFAGQVGPATFCALAFALCPDAGDDRLVGESVVVQSPLVVQPAVLGVILQKVCSWLSSRQLATPT